LEVETKVVYFDNQVKDSDGKWIGGTWVSVEKGMQVSTHLSKIGFTRKNSAELGRWMNQVLSEGVSDKTVLMFAQDIAPYDVYDDDTSNALIRQYLDNGGAVIWIGDVPFFYKSKSKGDHYEVTNFGGVIDGERKWDFPSPLNVLGVVPVSMAVSSRSSITRKGAAFGLRTSWSSMRPIVIPSYLETERTRITNFTLHRPGFIELAHAEGIGTPWVQPLARTGHLKKFLGFLGTGSIKAGPVEISSETAQKPLESSAKYVSAWIKTFDRSSKGGGFIRLWDFAPRIVTEKMLAEVTTLLRSYCRTRLKASVL
jgi:hypothetical protein